MTDKIDHTERLSAQVLYDPADRDAVSARNYLMMGTWYAIGYCEALRRENSATSDLVDTDDFGAYCAMREYRFRRHEHGPSLPSVPALFEAYRSVVGS